MPIAQRRPLALLALAAATLALAGCAGRGKGKEFDMRGSPERIYSEAERDMRGGNYAESIRKFELLEARFPFSEPAKQAQLDLMYAYYKNREADSAIDQADQFIRENPTHPRVDYAYYIRGLVYFEGGANALERVFKADLVKRPPQDATKSLQSLQTLVQAYPKSPYAADARQRIVYLRNRLADYELAVARYYMKRGAYVGALNRARGLIESYDGAPAVDAALEIAAKAYDRLNLEDLAVVARDIRAQNANLPDLVPATLAAGAAGSSGTGAAAEGSAGTGDAGSLAAQRAGLWEVRAGVVGSNATDVDFKGGTTVNVDSAAGFLLGVAWHYSDRLQFGSSFTYDDKDYDASIAGDEPDETFEVRGSLESMSLMLDAAYELLGGPVTPFVSGGLGWSWVDTNIATSPPTVGCWWDPWYGYVCTSFRNTKTLNGLAYEVGLGLRYDINEVFALQGAYRMRWVDFENATGTPSFDGFTLALGWKF
jgi:outer membrane protein assembly factor BamD